MGAQGRRRWVIPTRGDDLLKPKESMFCLRSEHPCERLKKSSNCTLKPGSERQISKISVLGKGTVRRFLKRAEAAGLSRALPPSLDDAGLEKKLFPPPPP